MTRFGIHKLRGRIQNYPWGSHSFLAGLRGESVPSKEPEAELWIGVHPQAPSEVSLEGSWKSLEAVIHESPEAILGARTSAHFEGRLPFLLKVLACEEPLSIQLHPNVQQARAGLARGTYTDARHKPELAVALTSFTLLRDFRPASEIVELFRRGCGGALSSEIQALQDQPGAAGILRFLGRLLRLDPAKAKAALAEAAAVSQQTSFEAPFEWVQRLLTHYPDDVGCLAPLYMNLLRLEPGEATFQPPGILHGYLEGAAVEVMADSDNVTRAALTSKKTDVEELLHLVRSESGESEAVKAVEKESGWRTYSPPVEEFRLTTLALEGERSFESPESVQIWLCTEGSVSLSGAESEPVILAASESAVVSAAVESFSAVGQGTCFIASVP